MASAYSVFSATGLVSSSLRLQRPAEFLGYAKVQADTLGMAQVEVSIWFGREAGVHASVVFAAFLVVLDAGAE